MLIKIAVSPHAWTMEVKYNHVFSSTEVWPYLLLENVITAIVEPKSRTIEISLPTSCISPDSVNSNIYRVSNVKLYSIIGTCSAA